MSSVNINATDRSPQGWCNSCICIKVTNSHPSPSVRPALCSVCVHVSMAALMFSFSFFFQGPGAPSLCPVPSLLTLHVVPCILYLGPLALGGRP
ncbi:hypothetical protein GGS24DRAFT_466676 [Hypoxylon argillaceum]|nr:hypothetical protein GGS24DRAFT_466676 [Hypoxylon argillaceum]